MKKILILGAGLSASTMIKYLLDKSQSNNWTITLADADVETANRKVNGNPAGKVVKFDIHNAALLKELVVAHDIVVSMLPAMFHPIVAKECLAYKKHMFTASYVSPEMKAMEPEIKAAGLFFMNECGVDPGIDHMSAMKVIDEIKHLGGKLESFESNTGGLVAPQSDNNPWNYKFTWNARNVVLAGQAGSKFLQNGTYKYIPYQQLFKRTYTATVLDYGEFDVYANRDSLSYREVYGLNDIKTLFRGTMRRKGYCEAWNLFVQLGMTDDTYVLENSHKFTKRTFLESYLPDVKGQSTEDTFCQYLGIKRESDMFKKMEWLGMFSNEALTKENASPAQLLQSILEPKLKLDKEDLDMIVMQHRFLYELNGKKYEKLSSLVCIGKDNVDTAMSITVGMPLAIAIELFVQGKVSGSGVKVPVTPDLYLPILNGLEPFGVKFIEEEKAI
ncbi:MAG: saccharopine dehydrogenase [Bacteroidetes bacterium HGW-Bacteroidetes-21]|nr:MAG: saccharopine dehydrogenase [Bacteroidetes bacterium HGW-Bacteroidetes-21]